MTLHISCRGAALAAALFVFAAILPAAAQSPGGNTLGVQFVYSHQQYEPHYGLGIQLTADVIGRLSLDAEADTFPYGNGGGGLNSIVELALGPRFRVFSRRRWAIYAGLLPWLTWSTNGSGVYGWFLEAEGTVEYRLPHRWLWRTTVGYLGNKNYGNFTGFFQLSSGLAYRF